MLATLVDELEQSELDRIRPTHVVTGSEQLQRMQRERIENGFDCTVIDVYGCTELVFIAMESPDRIGYRVCEEAVIVEVLDESLQPSTRGEIYLTGLLQWSMPFIRYRLGDVVTVQSADEPRLHLRSIDGRINERFKLSDGRELHGYTLGEIVERHSANVRQFQIIQPCRGLFRFVLVGDGLDQAVLRKIDHDARSLLGGNVEVCIETVDAFPRSQRKFHTFISLESQRALDEHAPCKPTSG